jgi:hypothetical protein
VNLDEARTRRALGIGDLLHRELKARVKERATADNPVMFRQQDYDFMHAAYKELAALSALHLGEIKRLTERLERIEEKGIVYRGIYDPNREYKLGDLVTFGGSMFHCLRDTIGCPPMHGLSDEGQHQPRPDHYPWQLAVKRGRDRKG